MQGRPKYTSVAVLSGTSDVEPSMETIRSPLQNTPGLVRWAGQCRRPGIAGCIDGRWLRRSSGRHSVTEQLREAICAVHAECLHRSRVPMKTRERLIRPGQVVALDTSPLG